MAIQRTKLPAEEMAKLWKAYKAKPSEVGRNALVENYLPIVKYTAERLYAKLPDEVDLDDLMSVGVFGLLDAIKSFDLTRGVKFETFCVPRIRGAILDELRSMDWVPRLVRSRAHKLDVAVRALEMELGRKPTETELAKTMDVSLPELRKLARDAQAVSVVSLNRKWFETDSHKDVREIDMLEDKRIENPLLKAQAKDIKNLITRGLNRAERLIIILYYYEQMTMKEIAAALNLSETRICQIHTDIIDRLRDIMQDRVHEFEGI